MNRSKIEPSDFVVAPDRIWNKTWFLLTCGDFASGKFNTMTVAWGSMGVMWFKPFVQVVVRPTRYTYEFMEQYESFTLSALGDDHRKALQFMGSHSGRDTDKIAETGLTPIASSAVAAPGYDEAELIIECRKTYWQDMDPSQFVDPSIEQHYPEKDYHRIYFGQVLGVQGTEQYQ